MSLERGRQSLRSSDRQNCWWGGLGFETSSITVRILSSVKAWSGRSGNKAEVEQDYRDDEKDEVEGSEGIRNEKRT
jgi:hypothetical protein